MKENGYNISSLALVFIFTLKKYHLYNPCSYSHIRLVVVDGFILD